MAALVDLENQKVTGVRKDIPLPQLVRLREDVDAEIETLCNVMYQLNVSRVQYENSIEIITKLNRTMDGRPAMIPLTNNMYAPAVLGRTNDIVVSLGNDCQIGVDQETAINHLFVRIQRIKTKIGTTQKMLASKVLERERLRKLASEKFVEEQKKAEALKIRTDLADFHE